MWDVPKKGPACQDGLQEEGRRERQRISKAEAVGPSI